MKKIIILLLAISLLLGCTNNTQQLDNNYPDINEIVKDNNTIDTNSIIPDTNKIISPVVPKLDINYVNIKDLDIQTPGTDYQIENYEYTPDAPI